MTDGITDYYCPTCGAGFDRLPDCWAHERDVHEIQPLGSAR